MIEFDGELCSKCKNYIQKKVTIAICFNIFQMLASLSAVLIITGILWGRWIVSGLVLGTIALSGIIFMLGNLRVLSPSNSKKIIIKDGAIFLEYEKPYKKSRVRAGDNAAGNAQNGIPRGNWRTVRLDIPTELAIETDTDCCEKAYISRKISHVKRVVDMGEWYQIVFYFGYKSAYFACQKDLISGGTIKDFEKLFDGKIS